MLEGVGEFVGLSGLSVGTEVLVGVGVDVVSPLGVDRPANLSANENLGISLFASTQ